MVNIPLEGIVGIGLYLLIQQGLKSGKLNILGKAISMIVYLSLMIIFIYLCFIVIRDKYNYELCSLHAIIVLIAVNSFITIKNFIKQIK